jgi:hypothetical protein
MNVRIIKKHKAPYLDEPFFAELRANPSWLKKTTWSPDTCSCVIDYTWDSRVSEDDRKHFFKDMISTCPAHKHVGDGLSIFSIVVDENSRKNIFERIAMQNVEKHLLDESEIDENGKPLIKWRKGVRYEFKFEGTAPQRIVNVRVAGANFHNDFIARLQSLADKEFGIDKLNVIADSTITPTPLIVSKTPVYKTDIR